MNPESNPLTGPVVKKRTPDKVIIIAEAGVNHNGDLQMAVSLVEEAYKAGADIIKFQAYLPEEMIATNTPKAPYQLSRTFAGENQYQMLKRLQLTAEEYGILFKKCNELGITFLASVFDEKSAEIMEKMGVAAFKIPSGELTNIPLVQKVAAYKKPLIISTGMATLSEVEDAVAAAEESRNRNITLLHCVSSYPAPFETLNLTVIRTLRESFGLPVGFSDHTEGIVATVAAIALGAVMVEKHFTLDKKLDGPDHRLSMSPDELREYVKWIRRTEKAMGNGRKNVTSEEKNVRSVTRKSLVTKVDIAEKTIISEEMLTAKRPETGISPRYLELIKGTRAAHFIPKDTLLYWNDIIFKGREEDDAGTYGNNGMQGRLWDLSSGIKRD